MKPDNDTVSRLLDELVRERIGLASARRRPRALQSAMERAGVNDEAVYLALVKRDRHAFDALIADLTVPETYFFRDPAHYELLRQDVLPALRARGREHVIEVWSAGCATGEEPYSLAMLLDQELLGGRSHVLGTDVSTRALARASEAVYGRWSLRATGERERARYFEPCGREYRLSERIRQQVLFRQHTLMASAYPSPRSRGLGFDLILCRNVLIYFDPAATAHTGHMLASSLCEDGWLMLGPSDPFLGLEEWCDIIRTPYGLLYRRRGPGAHKPQAHHAPRHATECGSIPSSEHPPSAAGDAVEARADRPARTTPEAPMPSPLPTQATTSPAHPGLEQLQALLLDHGPAAAEAGCRDLLERHALSAPLYLLHATLLVDLGRDADAEHALRRALYLDRSLLIGQLLSATLRERSGAQAEAVRWYEQLATLAREKPAAETVFLGEGLTHGALADLAERRARALSSRGKA